MRDLNLISNLYYFIWGAELILLKFLPLKYMIGVFIVSFIINYIILKYSKKLRKEAFSLSSFFLLIPVISLFHSKLITGLLIISNIFSDRIAYIIRRSTKKLTGSLFFALSFFILSLLFLLYLQGILTTKNLVYIFILALLFTVLEEIKLSPLPDNLALTLTGGILAFLLSLSDYSLRISSFGLAFGLLICIFFTLIAILFDVIPLKKALYFYLYILFLYNSMGAYITFFVLLIFITHTLISGKDLLSEKFPVDSIAFLPLSVSGIYFIIPHYKFIKSALFVALLLYVYYEYITLQPEWTGRKKIKILNRVYTLKSLGIGIGGLMVLLFLGIKWHLINIYSGIIILATGVLISHVLNLKPIKSFFLKYNVGIFILTQLFFIISLLFYRL